MFSNKVAFGVIGLVGMLGAAGAGAWIANRHTTPGDAPTTAVTTPPSTIPAVGGAVEATEAVMEDKDVPAAAAGSGTPALDKPASAPVVSAPVAPSAPVARARAAKKSRTPDRPVTAQQKPAATPTPVQPARDQHAANRPEREAPRREPSSVAAESHPVETTARAETATPEPATPPAPPVPQFVEVTVPADSVIGLQIETALSSETSHVEDRVTARVTRDVRADGRVAIPAGSRVLGSVSVVDRGGRMKEQARLGVRFHTVILADGTELPLQTETILREGDSPAQASAAKIGGAAIGGAILGAIFGGGKGAAIGGAVGGAGGTAAVMASDRRPAKIAAGSPVTVKVLSPVTVTVEKE
jgi:type IV secretory pathway VirB10-like protein